MFAHAIPLGELPQAGIINSELSLGLWAGRNAYLSTGSPAALALTSQKGNHDADLPYQD
jgi:hypothetical protein